MASRLLTKISRLFRIPVVTGVLRWTWRLLPILVMMDVEARQTLVACVSAGHGMGLVARQVDKPAVFDRRHQPARRLTDTAEGRGALRGHWRVRSRPYRVTTDDLPTPP